MATAAFGLAMLAKPQVASLPGIALALGIAIGPQAVAVPGAVVRVASLVPWLAVVATLSVVSRSQQPGEAGGVPVAWWQRPIIAGDALVHYAGKLVYPVDPAVDYGRASDTVLADPANVWPALAAWLVAGVVIAWPRRSPLRLPAIVWIMGLAPTLGFIPFVHQGLSTVADRYAYVAMLGPAIACASLWDAAIPRPAAAAIRAAVIAAVGIAGAVAAAQAGVWSSSETLFRQSLRVNPASFFARLNLGNALVGAGRIQEAIPVLRSAVAAGGEYTVKYKAHASLAQALHRLGDRPAAAEEYRRAIAFTPDWAHLHNDYGVLLAEQGNLCAAAARFREARRLGLDTAEVRRNLAAAEAGCGRPAAVR